MTPQEFIDKFEEYVRQDSSTPFYPRGNSMRSGWNWGIVDLISDAGSLSDHKDEVKELLELQYSASKNSYNKHLCSIDSLRVSLKDILGL